MKKIIFITSGILVFLIVAAVFGYLFLFGTPQSADDIFARFGGNDAAFEAQPEENIFVDTQGPIIASDTLRQITTKPVVGMVFLDTRTARYMEQGTGHIFDIALDTGVETQVSNTTFTKVHAAYFSPDGTNVIFSYSEAGLTRNAVGLIGDGALTTTSILSSARDFSWDSTGEALTNIVETAQGTEGYRYDVTDKSSDLLFRAPFGSARAIWGNTATYVYTKPTASLKGYVYETTGGDIDPVTSGAFGLTAVAYAGGVIITETVDGALVSSAISGNAVHDVAVPLLPEKCIALTSGEGDLVCAAPLTLPANATLPDDWYKGSVRFTDLLWRVDVVAEEATLIVDPQSETGRTLDVVRIESAKNADEYLLIHKVNNTLWLLTP